MTQSPGQNLSPVKRALLEIRRLRAQVDAAGKHRHEPIAIVGAALRFPGGAVDMESFWELLRNGVDATGEMPQRDWDIDAFFNPEMDTPGKFYAKRGGFLNNIDQFDAALFGITPREASSMDPQQRLLLEVCWEAIENAATSPDKLSGTRTGLFMGISYSDYIRHLLERTGGTDPYCVTGNALSVSASRLAYHLNLQGPAMAVDTACSSSLVAIHLAVNSLRAGESEVALAGGVSLILTPEFNVTFCQSRMLAADGHCKTFDEAADGYSRGEGCAVVMLKRLSDAKRNGDPILAVIRGTALNHDGRAASVTAPSGPAQEAVIREALADAKLSPEAIDYIELHGTGTPLGDPIEANALGNALGRVRAGKPALPVGSVKTNFGHLEAAAGIAGLLKAVLVLRHGDIPPHLHLKQVSHHIDLERLGLTIPSELMPAPAGVDYRIAGISSFGLSGTNAHMIIEKAPEIEPAHGEAPRRQQLFVASARTQDALQAMVQKYQGHLTHHTEQAWADVCHTAATGRAHLNHRMCFVARDALAARKKLDAFIQGESVDGIYHRYVADIDRHPRVAFLFPGQGAQYSGMGRKLYESQPVFRAAMDRCAAILIHEIPRPILEVIYEENGTDINETLYSQAAMVAIEYSLAQLWMSWGVQPSAVVGHSLGEYTAACIAGVISLEDALGMVAARGRLATTLPPNGAMAVIFASEDSVNSIIREMGVNVSIAAINGPLNNVISGISADVAAMVDRFQRDGVETRSLAISRSFHSPQVDPILPAFRERAAAIQFSQPQIPLLSNVTGQFIGYEEISSPDYWTRHLREPVRFADGVQALANENYTIGLEVGPRPVLVGMATQVVPDSPILWLHSLRSSTEDWVEILENLGRYYTAGGRIDWDGVNASAAVQRVSLPTYAFDHKRYWHDQLDGFAGPKKSATSREIANQDIWKHIAQASERQAQSVPFDLPTASYAGRWELLDRLSTGYIVKALSALEAINGENDCMNAEALIRQRGVSETYKHLLGRWFDRLQHKGIVEPSGDGWKFNPEQCGEPIGALVQKADACFADTPRLIDYIHRCGRDLKMYLTGETSPLETLFPGGDSSLAEYIYGQWPISRYISGIATQAASALALMRAGGRDLRILEIGAGTGGTASAIIPALPRDGVEYHFTDVSEFFFARATERFGEFPGLNLGILDIGKDPGPQGFVQHNFDAIVATNVLHATPDIEQTLRNAMELLAPGGVLIISEVTRHLEWYDITTGLIEGWQIFEDKWRGDNPLLSPGRWRELMESLGFSNLRILPEEGSPTEIFGQHVILAQTPLSGNSSASSGMVSGGSAKTKPAARVATKVEANSNFLGQLRATHATQRMGLLTARVGDHIKRLLRLDSAETLDPRGRLMEMGVDSLMAVELRNALRKDLEIDGPLPATLIFEHPTIEAIAAHMAEKYLKEFMSENREDDVTSDTPATDMESTVSEPEVGGDLDAIADLSDEEIERRLLARLSGQDQD